MSDSSVKTKRYFNLFQILRAVAFLVVYTYHNIDTYEACKWAVCTFLVLSGFLDIYNSYDRELPTGFKGCFKYGCKKISGLYLLHVITTLWAAAILIAGNPAEFISRIPTSIFENTVKLISNLTLTSDLVPSAGRLIPYFGEYNIASWYLSLCFIIYICQPVIIRLMHRIYAKKISPVFVIACIFTFTLVLNLIHVRIFGRDGAFWYNYESPLSRIGDYLIGAQLGYMYRLRDAVHRADVPDVPGVKFRVILSCALIVVINTIFFVACFRFNASLIWLASTGFYFTIPVACLIYSIAVMEEYVHIPADAPALRPVMTLGAISGYAYLIHVPVINTVHGIYKRVAEVKLPVWAAVSLLLTFVLAWLAGRKSNGKGFRTASEK